MADRHSKFDRFSKGLFILGETSHLDEIIIISRLYNKSIPPE